ncbi:hypothetical protein NE237_014428 [Protea cynaroides]|uniref:Large ribosomal subunit protein mL45 n=1 Tax=Protea cynaroides TaxID=273540 RepID=A0A9Q0KC27_9MAGN|nr:hypothetical protein NE237_014428 [Protea cynaroides]
MALKRSTIQHLLRSLESRKLTSLHGSSRSYSNIDVKGLIHGSNMLSLCKEHGSFPWIRGSATTLRSTMGTQLSFFLNDIRLVTTQVKAPPQIRQMGAFQVAMQSPGIIYEPYAPREPIPFWRRLLKLLLFISFVLKSAYAINKLRKSGYSKQKFYVEAVQLYKEINTLIAIGDKTSLRKLVTENMYSGLKNEIKQRESKWSAVYWELIEPVVKIRTLRARLIGVDKSDLNKVFIQLTLEFLTKQKFEAYDLKGAIIAGDKTKEILVRDIWVFEKSMFHTGADWRLCGRLSV